MKLISKLDAFGISSSAPFWHLNPLECGYAAYLCGLTMSVV